MSTLFGLSTSLGGEHAPARGMSAASPGSARPARPVAARTVQAASAGLYLHQMGGFDPAKAQEIFAIPSDFAPQSLIALGYLGEAELLDDEKQRERHNSPVRKRKPLSEIVFTEWEKAAF